MTTFISIIVVIALLAIGVLSGYFLAVLHLHKARDSNKPPPTLDPRGLHPLDQSTH